MFDMIKNRTRTTFAAIAMALALFAPMAMAQSLGSAALAEITTLGTDVNAILIALIVVVFAILAFVYFKRAAK